MSLAAPGPSGLSTGLLRFAFSLLLVSLAAAWPAAAAAGPHDVPAEVSAALERWDLQGARRALDRLPERAGSASTWLRGMTEFYAGEYREAERLLRSAVEGVPGGGGGAMMVQLAGDTAELAERLRLFESEHFSLFLDSDRDWVLAGPALETLEAAYSSLGDWLGHFPSDKVRVEIVPSSADFGKVSSLTEGDIENSGAIGICKFNKIMILSPRALLQGYRWRDSLVHEYIHYLLVAVSSNRAPIWLQEGVARYGETMWRSAERLQLSLGDESLVAKALRENSLVAFERMEPSLVKLPTMGQVQLAFVQCSLAVEHLLERWGRDGLRAILAALATAGVRDNAEPALRRVTGLSLAEFEDDLHRAMAGRGFREIPGLMIPALKVAEEGEAGDEWDLESWQPLEARRHLKLGDMLRRRGRQEGALAEYRRALGISPSSPYVRTKVARVLLDLSRYEEAEKHLREASAVHPDYPTAYALLGSVLAGTGRLGRAAEAFEEYLEINPFDPYVWKDLGAVRMESGDREEALRSWETALRLNPDDLELQRVLGKNHGTPNKGRIR